VPTGLVHVALWASLIVTLALAARALRTLVKDRQAFLSRLRWDGATGHNVAFILYGLVITALPSVAFRHYLIVTYPFQAFTLPLLASLGGQRVVVSRWGLAIAWVAHAILAASMLAYLAAHHGAPGGDFGVAFEAQHWAR
jgi:hypothetical protein